MTASHSMMVRSTARYEVVLPVRMQVAAAHAALVRLASGTRQRPEIDGQLLDISSSGAGVMTYGFLPRMTKVELELPGEAGPDPDAAPGRGFHMPCRVLRVVMTDRRPAYLVGLAFEVESAGRDALLSLDRLLASLDVVGDIESEGRRRA